jgi:hypothetical protein
MRFLRLHQDCYASDRLKGVVAREEVGINGPEIHKVHEAVNEYSELFPNFRLLFVVLRQFVSHVLRL